MIKVAVTRTARSVGRHGLAGLGTRGLAAVATTRDARSNTPYFANVKSETPPVRSRGHIKGHSSLDLQAPLARVGLSKAARDTRSRDGYIAWPAERPSDLHDVPERSRPDSHARRRNLQLNWHRS